MIKTGIGEGDSRHAFDRQKINRMPATMAPSSRGRLADTILREARGKLSVGAYFVLGIFLIITSMPIRLGIPTKLFASVGLLDMGVWFTAGFLLLFSVRDGFYFGKKDLTVLLFLPAAIAILSFMWTSDNVATFKYAYYSLTSALGFWVTVNIFRYASPRAILRFMAFIVGVSLLIALLYWSRIPWVWSLFRFSNLQVDQWDEFERAAAFARLDHPYIGRSNDYATFLGLFTVIFYGISTVTKRFRYLCVCVITFIGIALTLSRGVLVAVGLVFIIALIASRPSRFTLVAMLGLLLAATSTYFYTAAVRDSGIDIISDRLNEMQNIENRVERFKVALDLIYEAPILGTGGGRYLLSSFDSVESAVHNTYLEQIVSFGIPLGILIIFSLLRIPYVIWQWPSRAPLTKSVAKYASAGVFAYLLICLTQTSNEAAMPRLYFHIYLGLMVSLLTALEANIYRHNHVMPKDNTLLGSSGISS